MGNGTVGIVRTIGTITSIERLLKDILEKKSFPRHYHHQYADV